MSTIQHFLQSISGFFSHELPIPVWFFLATMILLVYYFEKANRLEERYALLQSNVRANIRRQTHSAETPDELEAILERHDRTWKGLGA